jgi:hypothetical protein
MNKHVKKIKTRGIAIPIGHLHHVSEVLSTGYLRASSAETKKPQILFL